MKTQKFPRGLVSGLWVGWSRQSGSLFGGLSGSHLQIKLSGCDPGITGSLESNVGIWWVSELWVWWIYWNIIGVKPAYYPKLFWSMWCPKIHLCARDWFCILPRMKKSMALFHIKSFSCHVTILLKRKRQHMGGHKWVICGSHPDCSVGQWVK